MTKKTTIRSQGTGTTKKKYPKDYVAIAREYAAQAIADSEQNRFGKWIRLAAERFERDLATALEPDAPFWFSENHANDACDFIEKLPHVEGVWATPNLVLHPAHVLYLVLLFGFRTPAGDRRFSSSLFACGRKNSKSTLSAAILVYCLCCEDEQGPQVISAATTGDQAGIVFNIAKRMVEKTPALRHHFGLETFKKTVIRPKVGGVFKTINAKASTQDGLNPSHTCLDEIHAHKTADLLNVLTSAAGARQNPLWLYTTTEGYESPGPWAELRHFGKQVLTQVVEADHFLVLIFALDDEDKETGRPADDDFDESKWVKANPLMEVNPILLKELQKAAIEAKAMPGRHAEFRIKRLNRQSSTATGWIDMPKWRACNGAVNLSDLKGQKCYGGLDLASTRDLTSFRLLWNLDGIYYTWGIRWVPESAVAQRTERGTVRYDSWVAQGFIKQTPGDVADYRMIEADIKEIFDQFKPEEVGFDDWKAQELTSNLMEYGVPLIQITQGPKSYDPPMQALERAYIAGNLRHGGDPVLQWCASNLVPRYDGNMNMAPDRKRSADKIDDMASLLMAWARCLLAEPVEEAQLFFFGR